MIGTSLFVKSAVPTVSASLVETVTPVGSFASEPGLSSCTLCDPRGDVQLETTLAKAATSRDECVCVESTARNMQGECESCGAGLRCAFNKSVEILPQYASVPAVGAGTPQSRLLEAENLKS